MLGLMNTTGGTGPGGVGDAKCTSPLKPLGYPLALHATLVNDQDRTSLHAARHDPFPLDADQPGVVSARIQE